MKKIIIFVVIFVSLCSFVFADYKANMAAGNAAYKAGNLEEALKLYQAALEEQPSDQLFAFADKLKKKIEDKKQLAGAAGVSGKSDKTALFVVDIALAGIAAASYLDYAANGAAYETLYTAINNTTAANYNILVNEKARVDSQGTFMTVAVGVAGAAVLYTLADLFIFSNASSQAVTARINPVTEYAGLTVQWRF